MISEHKIFLLVLVIATILYIAFPLQLQSMEAYSYAASIERYYNISTTFALSQGEYLPDFGRYHPNHPLGHVLAGVAFDWFKIPALGWIRLTNVISTLATAVFVYLLGLQMRLSRGVSTAASVLFLTTHASLLAVYSGEWHMPSLALSLGGSWQILFYVFNGTVKHLYVGAVLLSVAVFYHTGALPISVCLAVLLFFVRTNEWRRLLIVGAAALFAIVIVYFVLPFFVLHFAKPSDFLRTFFMYAHLEYRQFSGFGWILAASQTLFHSFIFLPATIPVMKWVSIPFFLGLIATGWKFFRGDVDFRVKILFVFMLFGWPITQAIIGTRANAVYSWLFMLPLLCIVVAYALFKVHKRVIISASLIPIFMLAWNFHHQIIPNRLFNGEDTYLFKIPEHIPKTTPIAFVVNELVLAINEIWYAGSELNYRNQNVFYPCCGEDSYLFRLRRWLRANPGAIIVSDGTPEIIETFLQREQLDYARWYDRRVAWPASLLPATLYFIREPGYKYQKRLIAWLPASRTTPP